jgi:hypothetical protein
MYCNTYECTAGAVSVIAKLAIRGKTEHCTVYCILYCTAGAVSVISEPAKAKLYTVFFTVL